MLAPLCGPLGRNIHVWHQELLNTGQSRSELLFQGFDMERFNQHKPESGRVDEAGLFEMQGQLNHVLEQNLTEYLVAQNTVQLCATGRISELHELRDFLQKTGQRYACNLSA